MSASPRTTPRSSAAWTLTAWHGWTADGERQIGEFKAGTPEEGLKHFGARYDDLSTEVQMLEARLQSHPEQAQTIRHDAKILQDSLPTAAVIGDIAALDARLEKISQRTQTAEKQVAEAKQERRDSALAQKEELLGEVEGIAAADAGRTLPYEDVRRWVLSWGTPDELPRPQRG